MLSAREKLTLLIQGKATLKEINELEALAEQEPEVQEVEPEVQEVEPEVEQPDYEQQIAELKQLNEDLQTKLSEAQAENVNANNETPSVSFDEQLEEMFKDIRI